MPERVYPGGVDPSNANPRGGYTSGSRSRGLMRASSEAIGKGGRHGIRALTLVCALLGLATSAQAGGAIYSFTDENGVIHFTGTRKDARYRLAEGLNKPRRAKPPAPRDWRYDGLIGLTARQHRVQPALVKAVIAVESNFDANAVSNKGAQGLMQLMPETSVSLGVEDPFQPTQNVRAGTLYLRKMLDRYGDMERALAAYNAGPKAVDRHHGIPPYPETKAYVARVLEYYRGYRSQFVN